MSEKVSARPRHLGRGLQSLLSPIADSEIQKKNNSGMVERMPSQPLDSGGLEAREIPLDSISANPYQARTHWNEEKLVELANSIAANGIVQPIVVRKTPTGFQLIAGERRFRASQRLERKTIPAFIKQVNDEQMLEQSLVENIHRSDLNAVERAKAYQSYIKQYELTQTEASSRLGEDRSVISNHLRLLDLPIDVQNLLISGDLSMGHAKAILAVPTEELRRKMANLALADRLSVRELEKLVKKFIEPGESNTVVTKEPPAHIVDIENKLTNHLGTRVSIKTKNKGKKGRMIIEFGSLDEFDNLLEIIGVQITNDI